MSKFSCPVVRVASVEDHFNADRLNIVKLEGLAYTCISAKLSDGSPRYRAGDFVVYIPSQSVLPEWLLKHMGFWNEDAGKGTLAGANGDRVKPLKLRGVFSEGVLFPVTYDPQHWAGNGLSLKTGPDPDDIMGDFLTDDVSDAMGITKYSAPVPIHMAGECGRALHEQQAGSTV